MLDRVHPRISVWTQASIESKRATPGYWRTSRVGEGRAKQFCKSIVIAQHIWVPECVGGMLIKRLGEMQRARIVAKTQKRNGHGHRYFLTDAGKDLVDVIGSLGTWGERWVEVTTEHSDPGFALWA